MRYGDAYPVVFVRDIATTKVDDDGLVFDVEGLEVRAISSVR